MVFCDWLSIYQIHFNDLPVINDGFVVALSQDGEVEWTTSKKLVHKGSYDSKILISCDGNRVNLSGNVGRFDRSNNVFGYTVLECIAIANSILATLGLPPFTAGHALPVFRQGKSKLQVENYTFNDSNQVVANFKGLEKESDLDSGFIQTGAVITRIDLTMNFATGSPQNASNVINKLAGFKVGKFDPKQYGSSGVVWGIDHQNKGSKFWVMKVYDKAGDYLRQYCKSSKFFDLQLADFLLTQGIVRQEITIKSRYLLQNGLNSIRNWSVNGMEAKIFALFESPFAHSAMVDEFLEIPGRCGELAVAWRDGADLKKRLPERTFYRYRKELLKFGIDIAIPSNVTRLKTKVEVIELRPATIPSFYNLPSLEERKIAVAA